MLLGQVRRWFGVRLLDADSLLTLVVVRFLDADWWCWFLGPLGWFLGPLGWFLGQAAAACRTAASAAGLLTLFSTLFYTDLLPSDPLSSSCWSPTAWRKWRCAQAISGRRTAQHATRCSTRSRSRRACGARRRRQCARRTCHQVACPGLL